MSARRAPAQSAVKATGRVESRSVVKVGRVASPDPALAARAGRQGSPTFGRAADGPQSLAPHPAGPSAGPSERVRQAVKGWLASGRFAPGDRLPSENAIARELSVARGTVRAGLARLRRDGLVESRSKQGWFAAPARRKLMSETVVLLSCLGREPPPSLWGGWMDAVESGAAEEVRRAGMNVLVVHPERLAEEGLRQLLAEKPLGVLVSHGVAETETGLSLVTALAAGGLRVVVNCDGPGLEGLDRVVFDHEGGSYALARFLLERGRRRILRVWSAPPETYWLRARDTGYERACREAHVERLPRVCVPDTTPSGLPREDRLELRARHIAGFLTEHMLSHAPPDALMVTTDPEVFPAARACRFFGRRVPEDVEIVGYDNVWADMPGRELERARPSATVDKHNREAGGLMARLLLDRVAGRGPDGPARIMVGCELVRTPE